MQLLKFAFLTAAAFGGLQAEAATQPAWKQHQIVRGCQVYSFEGSLIKTFPGRMCIFLDDGRLVSADIHAVTLYDSNQNKIWSLPGHYHHQMTLSNDKKSVLVLGSKFQKRGDKQLREDLIKRISLDGKLISEIGSEEIHRHFNIKLTPSPFDTDPDSESLYGKSEETSHYNSVHEIPNNIYEKKDARFAAGGVIVNNGSGPVFLLSNDLKKILGQVRLPEASAIHDVQFSKEGKFYYLANLKQKQDGSEYSEGGFSTVDSYDPIKGKLVTLFMSDPPQVFYSKYCGSVQYLDRNTLLIAHLTLGYYIYDLRTKKMVFSNSWLNLVGDTTQGVQDYRLLDLRSFLAKWH